MVRAGGDTGTLGRDQEHESEEEEPTETERTTQLTNSQIALGLAVALPSEQAADQWAPCGAAGPPGAGCWAQGCGHRSL